jgi:hypothetical protein
VASNLHCPKPDGQTGETPPSPPANRGGAARTAAAHGRNSPNPAPPSTTPKLESSYVMLREWRKGWYPAYLGSRQRPPPPTTWWRDSATELLPRRAIPPALVVRSHCASLRNTHLSNHEHPELLTGRMGRRFRVVVGSLRRTIVKMVDDGGLWRREVQGRCARWPQGPGI